MRPVVRAARARSRFVYPPPVRTRGIGRGVVAWALAIGVVAAAGCGGNMRAWQRRSAEAIQVCHQRDIEVYDFERLEDRREWVAVCNGQRWACTALDDDMGRGGEASCTPIE